MCNEMKMESLILKNVLVYDFQYNKAIFAQ